MSLRSEWAKAVTKYKTKKAVPAVFGDACHLVDEAYARFAAAKKGTDDRRKALKALDKSVTFLRTQAYTALVNVIGMGIMVSGKKKPEESGIPEVNLHMASRKIIDAAKATLDKASRQWAAEPVKTKTTGKTKNTVQEQTL
jgi:hypothetical protein